MMPTHLTRCGRCDYRLRGLNAQGHCPECGEPYDHSEVGLPGEGPTRDRRRPALTRIDIVVTSILATLFVLLLIFLILLFPPG